MTEEEQRQEQFREEVRGFLAKDKATLDNLVVRVDKLEKTVVHGNGNPSLVTQFAAMQAQMENFRGEISELKTKMNTLDEVKTEVTSIRSKMDSNKESKQTWITFWLTLLAIVGVPIIEHFLFNR